MSLLIRGMDLPSDCWSCKCKRGSGDMYFCSIMKGDGSITCVEDYVESRHPNCPLIGLPDKHGRLIDADELIEQLRKNICVGCSNGMNGRTFSKYCLGCVILTMYGVIKNVVPTILEAEGGE